MTGIERTNTDDAPREHIHRIEKDVIIERRGDGNIWISPIDPTEKHIIVKEIPNEKSKSKAPKKKAKKVHSRIHKPAVESI
jgi:hypothetical protein